jgi:metal-responsive CopG/Arc/MetJ family transcriptional regulator
MMARMATATIVVSISEGVLEAVDAAAREDECRSSFITRVLRAAMKSRSDAEVTRRLNEIFAEPAIVVDEVDSAGTDWSDETW